MSRNFVAMPSATRVSKRCPWTPEEERLLIDAVSKGEQLAELELERVSVQVS